MTIKAGADSKKAFFPLAVAAVLIFTPAAVFSWGPTGHRVVSRIATGRLHDRTKAAVADILGSDQTSLADISNYPDALRYGDTDGGGLFEPPLKRDAQTAPWHYINIPVQADVSLTPTTAKLDEYSRCDQTAHGPTAQLLGDAAQNCIRAQIMLAFCMLRARPPATRESAEAAALRRRQRRAALMFLVHLVGDAHQPMHASIDHDDAGGNVEQVRFEGRKMRLHALWDDLIDKTPWKDQAPDAAEALAKQLAAQLDELPAGEVNSWIAADVETTVNNAIGESFNISKMTIYPDYYREQQAEHGQSPVDLDPGYKDRMQPIAYKRLQQAGVRLAHFLNQVDWDGDGRSSNLFGPVGGKP